MINKTQLEKLNNLECSEHKKKPNAKYNGEDLNFDICCENFTEEIKKFVRDNTLDNLQKATRKAFGLN